MDAFPSTLSEPAADSPVAADCARRDCTNGELLNAATPPKGDVVAAELGAVVVVDAGFLRADMTTHYAIHCLINTRFELS